jgi:protein O-mannosyl-transferase
LNEGRFDFTPAKNEDGVAKDGCGNFRRGGPGGATGNIPPKTVLDRLRLSGPMNPVQPPESRPASVALVAALLIAATALAYANSLKVPFLLDDASAITGNRSIALPLNWHSVLAATDAGTASGRPLLNASFALNRWASERSVRGYHIVNLLIHMGSGLVLFGLVRRALRMTKDPRKTFGASSWQIAGAAALIWVLHPLQTESVTYLSERAESLMGLFYLLTLYAFVRSAPDISIAAPKPDRRGGRSLWLALSVIACFCGMATKEVMVTAPLLVLLFDRAFLSGSFPAALRKRRGYYACLASSWLFLALLLSLHHLGDRTVGFGFGMSLPTYLATEAKALGIYAHLMVWPSPLIFDYGRECLVPNLGNVLPQMAAIAVVLTGTIALWKRNPPLGFLVSSVFIVLAPTSSFVPIAAQPIAESRMYLPSAALAILAALSVLRYFPRMGRAALLGIAGLLGFMTAARNATYASALSIWSDTIAKAPSSSRAQDNYGVELSKIPGRQPDALTHYLEAIKIRPDFPEAERDLAVALSRIPGRASEAIGHFEKAILLRPGFAEAQNGLGVELGKTPGRSQEAIEHLQAALDLRPSYAEAHNNLAVELARIPERSTEAIAHYEEAIRIEPAYAEAHNNLAVELTRLPGRTEEALDQFGQAIRIDPDYLNARCNRATFLATLPGRRDEAISEFQAALAVNPESVEANYGLGQLLVRARATQGEGLGCMEKASRLDPGRIDIHVTLANLFVALPGRLPEARTHYESALSLQPDLPEALNGLGVVYAKTGDIERAIQELQRAIKSRPGYQDAIDNLQALTSFGR